ncbi:MAG: general secretion pathway protein GspK [Verrucomicrobiota bacterium]
MRTLRAAAGVGGARASTLVIVLWIALGLVALGLYFGQSSALGLRASDQRAASIEAEQAIQGATRYAAYVLTNLDTPGVLPQFQVAPSFRPVVENVRVGDAAFWFLGRDVDRLASTMGRNLQPVFGLVDESSKLNLNTATLEMLELLPRMTPQLAAAIIDWRDENDEVSTDGAEDSTYQRLNPAYRCKNAPFESIEELRMVYGMTLDILAGEDANRNGVLDPNEDDYDSTPPLDNRNGRIEPGLWEYVTVHSRESITTTNGTAKVSVTAQGRQQLATLLQERFGNARANEILRRVGNQNAAGLLNFFVASGMSVEEFAQVEGDLTAGDGQTPQEGLVNVNSAPEAVLACIPGIGTDMAPQLVAYRQSNASRRNTVAWAAEILGTQRSQQAGRYLTGRSSVYSADVCAVGNLGRGSRRCRIIFDTSEGGLRIVQRTDLSHLGWPLGSRTWQQVQQQRQLTQNTR